MKEVVVLEIVNPIIGSLTHTLTHKRKEADGDSGENRA